MPTLSVNVAANADDAFRRLNGSFFTVDGNGNGVFNAAGRYDGTYNKYGCGLRFAGITIPRGALITAATISGKSYQSAGNPAGANPKTRIRAQAADNPGAFSDQTDFDARILTSGAVDAAKVTAAVAWDDMATWTDNATQTSPDISAVIQAIVNRSGWASGNAIVLFWDDFDGRTATDGAYRILRDKENGNPVTLSITYTVRGAAITASGGGTPTKTGRKGAAISTVTAGDDFTGVAGSDLSGRIATGPGSNGAAWSVDAAMTTVPGQGGIVISDANRARGAADPDFTDGFYLLGGVAASADEDVEADLTLICTSFNDEKAGVLIRWTDGNGSPTYNSRGYAIVYSPYSGLVEISRFVPIAEGGGVPVASATIATNLSPKFRIVPRGATITVYVAGTFALTFTDTDSKAILTPGRRGIRIRYGSTNASNSNGVHVDNFLAGLLGVPGTTPSLVTGGGSTTFQVSASHAVAHTGSISASGGGTPTKTGRKGARRAVTCNLGRTVTGTPTGTSQGTGLPATLIAAAGASDGLNYNAFPGAAPTSDGRVLLAWHHANDHVGSGTNKLYFAIATLDSNGELASLTTPVSLRTITGTNIADVAMIRLANGEHMVTWNESSTPGHANVNTVTTYRSLKSKNDGANWGSNANRDDGISYAQQVPGWATTVPAGSAGGAYAVAPCAPVQIPAGRPNAGRLVIATYGWDNRAIEDGGGSFSSHEYIKVCISDDAGDSYAVLTTMFPDTAGTAYDETCLEILDDDTIAAACRVIENNGADYSIWTAKTADWGATWGSKTRALGGGPGSGGVGYGGRPILRQVKNTGVLLRYRFMNGGSSWTGYKLSVDRCTTWGAGIDPWDGAAQRTTSQGSITSPRGMDIYGDIAATLIDNVVFYAWCEEVPGSGVCAMYGRAVTVTGTSASRSQNTVTGVPGAAGPPVHAPVVSGGGTPTVRGLKGARAAKRVSGGGLTTTGIVDAPPNIVVPGTYDLQLGRVALPTLLDDLKESVGDQLEAVGAAVVAGERRARGASFAFPIHKTGSDARQVGDRMRRQLRALLNNPAARIGAIYLRFTPDPELSGWLLIGDGDLEYTGGGVSFSNYKLTLSNAYIVARQRSHVQARRIEIDDRRLATTPRDTKGLIYENTWNANTALAVAWLPGAGGYQTRGLPLTGTPVASVAALMGAGAPCLLQHLEDGDIVALTGQPDEALMQQAELGDVIVLDRQGQPATAVSAARDLTPQASYGWEELYGPDQPISYPSGAPDLVVQNGVCRVTLTPSTGVINIDRVTGSGFAAACTVQPLCLSALTALQIRDASIVEWTPDSAVVRLVQDNTQASGLAEPAVRCETFITLRRGWDAPRVEAYLRSQGDSVRLRVLPVAAGASTVLFSTDLAATAITDGTDYGGFGFSLAGTKDPWTLIRPPSGPAIIPAVCTGATKAVGRVVGALRGIDFYDPATVAASYASVHLKVTTDAGPETVAAAHGQASLLDVRTIPTFLPR